MYKQKYILFSLLFVSNIIWAGKGPEGKSDNPKLVFVDIQKILPTSDDPAVLSRGSKQWADKMNNLAKTLKPGDEEMQELNDDYTKSRKEFEKLRKEFEALEKSGVTSEKAIREKQIALETKYKEVAQAEYQLQNKMQKRQELIKSEISKSQEALAPKLERIIEDMRVEENLFIIRKEAVLSANKKYDITDQVLDTLNKDYMTELKNKKESGKSEKLTKPEKSSKIAAA